MIVVSTNCICGGLDVDPARLYRQRVHGGLITEGLLRLFAGDALAPGGDEAGNPEYHFAPIDLASVSAIVWAPFTDQACGWSNHNMPDGTPYPYTDIPLVAKYGVIRPSLMTVNLWWHWLDRVTEKVPLRVFVPYPTAFLRDADVNQARMKARVLESNVTAQRVFANWKCLAVEHPEAYDAYWAHFTLASRVSFLHQLAQLLATSA